MLSPDQFLAQFPPLDPPCEAKLFDDLVEDEPDVFPLLKGRQSISEIPWNELSYGAIPFLFYVTDSRKFFIFSALYFLLGLQTSNAITERLESVLTVVFSDREFVKNLSQNERTLIETALEGIEVWYDRPQLIENE